MTVGIIGLGYVGLPLAVEFAEAGEKVVAVDVAPGKIESLARGESYVEDIASERLRAVADRIEPTTGYAALQTADAVLICVPTPLSPNREPDLGPLLASAHALAGVVRRGQLVVLANGVRVQRYNRLPEPTPVIWDRLRRVLFGTTEAGV